MAYDIGVRSELNNRGIDNDRIGWDQNSGSVMVDNQSFLRPQKNYDGTTFTDLGSFNNAYKTFSNNQKVSQMQDQLTNYQPQQNPYTSQISGIVSQLTNRMNTPQNPNDVYNSPQYAAAQAQLGRQSHDGIRAAQEALGSSGFGRSTALSQSAQRVQNDASNYLNTQMVPQIMNQLQAQKQSEMNNLMSLLNPLAQQQQFESQQQQQGHQNLLGVLNYLNGQNQLQVENQRADAGLTGMYQGQQTQQAQNQQFNQGMAQQEQQYRQLRDQIGDAQYQQKFDEDVRRYGIDYAADQAYRAGQLSLSQQGANLSREKFDWEKQQAENKAGNIDKELEGLYTGLSNGQLNANDANAEINQRFKMGLITEQDAAKLKDFIQKFSETKFTSASDGGVKRQVSSDDRLLSMTRDELLKAWESDPTGKQSGRPQYDWRSWILDPNGYRAGMTFELWHERYGPKMG